MSSSGKGFLAQCSTGVVARWVATAPLLVLPPSAVSGRREAEARGNERHRDGSPLTHGAAYLEALAVEPLLRSLDDDQPVDSDKTARLGGVREAGWPVVKNTTAVGGSGDEDDLAIGGDELLRPLDQFADSDEIPIRA